VSYRRSGSSSFFEEIERKKKRRRREKGDISLKKEVSKLFESVGLEAEVDAEVGACRVDVLITYGGRRLAVVCRQYEMDSSTIRDLINEWCWRKREMGLDGVLLVLMGCDVRWEHEKLARKCGIKIWDEEKFYELLSEAVEGRERVRDKVLIEAGLEEFNGLL